MSGDDITPVVPSNVEHLIYYYRDLSHNLIGAVPEGMLNKNTKLAYL